MPLEGVDQQNAALDAVVASLPVGGTWRLFWDLPTETQEDGSSFELPEDGGYASVVGGPADWAPASDATVTTSVPVEVGTSTDAYAEVAVYWAYCDASGAVVLWDELDEAIEVATAGTVVSFSPWLAWRGE